MLSCECSDSLRQRRRVSGAVGTRQQAAAGPRDADHRRAVRSPFAHLRRVADPLPHEPRMHPLGTSACACERQFCASPARRAEISQPSWASPKLRGRILPYRQLPELRTAMQTARAVQDHCLRCRTIMWKYGEPQVVRPTAHSITFCARACLSGETIHHNASQCKPCTRSHS